MVGRGVNGRPASPLRAELPWAGPQSHGGGAAPSPRRPGSMSGLWGRDESQDPFLWLRSITRSILHPLCLISTARKAGKSRAGPPTLGKSHHIAPSSAQPAAPPTSPPPQPFLFQAPRAKHRLLCWAYSQRGASPPSDGPSCRDSPWTRRVPLLFPSLRSGPGFRRLLSSQCWRWLWAPGEPWSLRKGRVRAGQ